MNRNDTPFNTLTPDTVIDAIESIGYLSDLRVFALNSYENRVYQIGIEDAEPLIAKFYRPNRWTDKQILEEHQFAFELVDAEVPVIPPLQRDGESLFRFNEHRFCLYQRRGGHAPELDNLDTLYTLGQHLGRIHGIAKTKPFSSRPEINVESYAIDARHFLLENDFISRNLLPAYESLSAQIIDKAQHYFDTVPHATIRLHGDCHPGNILQREDSMYIVDLDDARTGPAVQDLWMLISGDKNAQRLQFESILEGYEEFCEFDYQELRLIESLRTLRLIHFAGWLARRWHDPAFPQAFPWFNSENYWAKHILDLREQMALLDEPPIKIGQL